MAINAHNVRDPELGRQIALQGMTYAPTSELGLVFLFGRLAARLGFCVENIRPQFPDCLATHRGRRVRIEFEFWASSYETHRHTPTGCDIVVCWENDWEDRHKKYQHLEVIDLKKHVGALPRVFAVGCATSRNAGTLDDDSRVEWNVPRNAQVGDLIVMYRARDAEGQHVSEIRDLWKVVGPFTTYAKRNKYDAKPGLQTRLKRIVRLKRPLTYAQLSGDPTTRELGIVRARFQGKRDITDYWPLIYAKIVRLNPSAADRLKGYRFDG